MSGLNRTLGATLLALLAVTTSTCEAGRFGGPMMDLGTIYPGRTVSYTIPFEGGEQAVVSVVGSSPGNVDLYIYDGDGNVIEGIGAFERRVATVNVYRAGFFRVVLANTGTVPSNVVFRTN